MSPERWQQIEKVYSEALYREPSGRAAFLEEACGGEEELRKEIESLLAEAEHCSGFLSSPGFESALQSIGEFAHLPHTGAEADGVVAVVDQLSNRVPRRPAFFWFALAAGIGLLIFYVCAGWVIYWNKGGKSFGWQFSYSSARWNVTKVDPMGPAAGKLERADTVLAFDADSRAGKVGPEIYRQFVPPGSEYVIRISRQGDEREYPLRASSTPHRIGSPKAVSYFILSFAYYVTALAFGLMKPGDRVAQLGFAAGILTALRSLATPLSAYTGVAPDIGFVLNKLIWLSNPWPLALSYHFFYRFTCRSHTGIVWPVLGRFLYGACSLLLAAQLVFLAASLQGLEALIGLANRHFWVTELNVVFLGSWWREAFRFIGFAGICAVMILGYRHSSDSNLRRRIRWIAFGCAVGTAPLSAYILIGLLLSGMGWRELLGSATWSNLGFAADAFLVAIPASLTYAVLKHQVLDIHIVVRRGLRYLLARRVLQIILVLPSAGLILPIVSNPNRTLVELLHQSSSVVNLLLLALFSLNLKYRQQIKAWLDRRFFREAYRQEDILLGLMGRIKALDSVEEVSKLVCDQLDSALHPKWMYVCQWKGKSDDLAVVRATARGALETRAPVSAAVLRLLRNCKTSQECLMPRDGKPSLDPPGLEKLLVVPVATSHATVGGALLLGGKKSEEPYTVTDRHLLEGIADAMAVVFENFWLKRRVREGMQERQEVLGRLDRETIKLLN